MWIVLGVLAFGTLLGFLVRLATHPVRTLVRTVRVLLFLLGIAMVAVYFLLGSDVPDESRRELIPLIAAVFGAWLLTFVIPAVLALLARPLARE